MISYEKTQEGKEILALIKTCKSPKGIKTVDIASALNIKSQRASYLLNRLSDEHKVMRVKIVGEQGVGWLPKSEIRLSQNECRQFRSSTIACVTCASLRPSFDISEQQVSISRLC